MNRLTKKLINGTHFPNEKTNPSIAMIVNKLGKLEDLEEQLGCPLEVVLKALNEGIYVDNKKFFYKTPSLLKLNTTKCWCFEVRAEIYDLKDYKKTWWLKGDKK